MWACGVCGAQWREAVPTCIDCLSKEAAEAVRLREALQGLIGTCAPPVEALCAVHADGKWIAPETLTALNEARDALRSAAAVSSLGWPVDPPARAALVPVAAPPERSKDGDD